MGQQGGGNQCVRLWGAGRRENDRGQVCMCVCVCPCAFGGEGASTYQGCGVGEEGEAWVQAGLHGNCHPAAQVT
jgi:hypothetical protein